MKQFVHVECVHDPVVCFALQQNRVPPIKSIILENLEDEAKHRLQLTITANPQFMEPHVIHIDQLEALETIELAPRMDLSAEYLRHLEEKTSGYMTLKLESGDQVLFEQRLPIDVLSYDTWPGSSVFPEIISSFVTPNSPFVGSILKKASTILLQETGSGSLPGYQTGDPNDVLRQLSAIYSALQSAGIAYANPPASFEVNGQKIRLPDTIESQKLGTCLDTTLLFASCAEAIGIHPIVIFFQDHALPGFWLKEYFCPESCQDDKSIITKHMASGIHELIVVESTCLTSPRISFTEAVRLAQDNIYKEDYFKFFVDVKRSRIAQITPLPLRSASYRQDLNSDSDPIDQQPSIFQTEQIEIIPESPGETVELSMADKKIQHWQYSLLDLSLRNNLLNYRSHTQGIPLAVADIHLFEDQLAKGEKTFILPRPAEWDSSIRDFASELDHMKLKLLQDEMKNHRVRSLLSEMELERRLVTLYRRARNAMEESGANSLFAAIGFLKWFESPSHKQERFAPILLLPVELVRVSAKRGYYIRIRDEDIQINISLIEHLKHRFGIDASRLYDIPRDEHGADVRKVLTVMRRLIMNMDRWDVAEAVSIGVFSFSKFVMWYDLVHRTEELKKNKVVRSLMEGQPLWQADETMYAPLSREQDETQDLFVPLSHDGTQLEAILAASNENSFVLHGPPGSGKSQTIANMISQALASGKTVLFVAEKMAALHVVHNRLTQLGLGPFCLEAYSNKAQKKDVLQQLETSFSIHGKAGETDWKQVSAEIKVLKKQLNDYTQALHSKTGLGESVFEMIEKYSSIPSAKMIALDRDRVMTMDEDELKSQLEDVRKLSIAGFDCGDLQHNPWFGMKQEVYSLELHDFVAEHLKTILESSPRLNELTREFCEQWGIESNVMDYRFYVALHRIAHLLLNMPNINAGLLAESHFHQLKADVLTAVELGHLRDELRSRVRQTFDLSVLDLDADQLLIQWRTSENSWLLKKWIGQKKVEKQLKGHVTAGKLYAKDVPVHLEEIRKLKTYNMQLMEQDDMMHRHFAVLWNRSEGNWDGIRKALGWVEQMRQDLLTIADDPDVLASFATKLQRAVEAGFGQVKTGIEEYITVFDQVKATWEAIMDKLKFPDMHQPVHEQWAKGSADYAATLLQSMDQLKSMCHLSRVVRELEERGLSHVTAPYLQGEILAEELENSFLYSFYRMRIDAELLNNPVLSTFSQKSFEEKIERFSQLDNELRDLVKLEVYVRLMENAPNLQAQPMMNSEPGILSRAIKSKGRGISIRNLFERIPNLLPKIKPCFLMSPLSVAQYLSPHFPLFDLVIFDEASQLPTSEAIGAMARGKNVIVVGDPKQLPPTSFFKSQKVEDDDFETQDLESVLDDCLAIQMPQKHLRWHYRSEHESLISFSNNHFYENKLITIPSVDDQHSRVSFRNVQGVYDRGKTKQNQIEAEKVVEELFRRLSDPRYQHESIGIVTFSQAQQTLIEDLIDEHLKQDPSLEKYFTDEVAEPVFVKNLENVQGDERDIILFSVGYGPDEKGNISMNFGPLNREGGWRRLNVAVSRAKKEMVIFASMEPEAIQLSRTNSEGVKALRAFMEFAIRGREPLLFANRRNTVQANSKVISEKISQFLNEHGYRVKRNLGSSEFKIDLAVEHPFKKGRYLAAILIDGHHYGEIVVPRDREKLRNELLERMGWHVIKVWSIEWWHNERKQLDHLLNKLDQLKQAASANDSSPAQRMKPEDHKPSIEERIRRLVIPHDGTDQHGDRYQPAELERVMVPNEWFYTEEGLGIIMNQIKEVLQIEAPISFSQLVSRITAAWGFARSGAKIEEMIRIALKKMGVATTEEKNKFLWQSQEQINKFSLFRQADSFRRSPEDICIQEYMNGIKEIMSCSFRLPKEDLIRELSRRAGYTRISRAMKSYINEAIQALINSGFIAENGEDVVYTGG